MSFFGKRSITYLLKQRPRSRRQDRVLTVEPLERRTVLSGFGGAASFDGHRDFHRIDQHEGFRNSDRPPTEYRHDDRFAPRREPFSAFQTEPLAPLTHRPAPPPSPFPVSVSFRPEPPPPPLALPGNPFVVPATTTMETSRPTSDIWLFQRSSNVDSSISSAASLASRRPSATEHSSLSMTLLGVSISDIGTVHFPDQDETPIRASAAANRSGEKRASIVDQEERLDEAIDGQSWARKRRLLDAADPADSDEGDELIELVQGNDEKGRQAIDYLAAEFAAITQSEQSSGVSRLHLFPELIHWHESGNYAPTAVANELVELLAVSVASLTQLLHPASSQALNDRPTSMEFELVLSANLDHFQSLEILPPPEAGLSMYDAGSDGAPPAPEKEQPLQE